MSIRAGIFEDPFLHMIEEIAPDGRVIRALCGAHNIFVAARAFEELLRQSSAGTSLVMREKGRIIRQERATGEALTVHGGAGGGSLNPPPLQFKPR